MFRRALLWSLLAAYLIVVALWPAAATPVDLAFTGLDSVISAVPGPVLLLAAWIAWLRHRPAPVRAA
ncbi:hypothetical protein ABTZ58_10020 [Streptomyces sp. NPDC094143]|uniref:hypothetical protein n=1 Tax=Streptomyces sp. NPDC094143 TaxID=3155310 RepID=UPI003333D26E